MDAYVLPIKYALFTFPILAALLTVPFLIVQYRKYGYVNKFRSFILFSFLLYCITAYYLVILPLPKDTSNCIREGSLLTYAQLSPFEFVNDIARQTQFSWNNPASYLSLLKENSFLQVFFNICLTIPLGIYMRYYFRRNVWQTFIISACTALFFEVTQLTGLYGIYDCPYRLFDVDDLIINTLGGMLGFWLSPIFTYFLPRSEELDKNVELEHMTVGFIRRGISLLIDMMCMAMLMPLMIPIKLGFERAGAVFGSTDLNNAVYSVLCMFIIILIYMIILPTITGGRTIGKMVTRIHVIEDKRRGQPREITWIALVKRYGMLHIVLGGVFSLLMISALYGDLPRWGTLLSFVLLMILTAACGIHLLLRIFSSDKLLFYERMSGTRTVITVKRELDDSETKTDTSESSEMDEQSKLPEAAGKTIAAQEQVAEPTADAPRGTELLEVAAVRKVMDNLKDTDPEQKPSEDKPRDDTMLMSASNPPLPDDVTRELERLKRKIAQKDE
ncbi:VanZ family protein [Paenibacillus marinisediminis]